MTGLEKLQEIGAHKIFEQTHIAKRFVEDILNQKFASMNKIQFTGFVSILEREYNVDLDHLREAYKTYHGENNKDNEPFVVSQQQEEKAGGKMKGIYLGAALIAAAVLIVFFNPFSSEEKSIDKAPIKITQPEPVESELNNTTIEEAKLNMNQLEDETPKAEEAIVAEPVHVSKFEVIPRSKLWIGIVDLENFSRKQKLTSSAFELDAEKEWLLVMGHGYVNFEVNGEEKSFEDEKKVWFSYEEGKLRKLSRAEFKEKNRGKAW